MRQETLFSYHRAVGQSYLGNQSCVNLTNHHLRQKHFNPTTGLGFIQVTTQICDIVTRVQIAYPCFNLQKDCIYRTIFSYAALVILYYRRVLHCYTISRFNGNKLLLSP